MRALRASAAILLVTQALLVMHPVLLASTLFTGAGVLGKSVVFAREADVIAQGAALLVAPTVVVLLLVASWGVATSSRGVGALALQPFVLAAVVVPLLRESLLVAPSVLLVVTVTAVGVLIALAGAAPRVRARRRRWWFVVAYAAAAGALVIVSGLSSALPNSPLDRFGAQSTGTRATMPNLARPDTPQNPALGANPFNNARNDSWSTGAYALSAPGPEGPVDSVFTGGSCQTPSFDSRGRIVTLCATWTRTQALIIDPASLHVLVRREIPAAATSFVLDAKDRIVVFSGDSIWTLSPMDLRTIDTIDLSESLQDGEQLRAVLPDWTGQFWFTGSLGTAGVITDAGPQTVDLAEPIGGSFAVAEDGVYVATQVALYRLESGAPEPVWRLPLSAAEAATGHPSPTVFGEWGVAVMDNAESRRNLVVADRRTGTAVCEEPAFAKTGDAITAIDDTLVIENAQGYATAALIAGRSTEPGIAAFSAVDGECAARWTNREVRVPSAGTKATSKSGLVLTYAKPDSSGVDRWDFTALDARTGELVWTRLAGTGLAFDNAHSGVALGPQGDLFVGTRYGIAVLRG